MNILEYIEGLMDQGMTEEDAGRCADVIFNTDWDCDEDYDPEFDSWHEDYDPEFTETN